MKVQKRRVVCKFMDVFPKELPNLPFSKDLKFPTDLVNGMFKSLFDVCVIVFINDVLVFFEI